MDIDDIGNFFSDLSRRERSPQMVVKSKGILPKMAERFRLRIYNKLPRLFNVLFLILAIFFLPIVWKLLPSTFIFFCKNIQHIPTAQDFKELTQARWMQVSSVQNPGGLSV